MELSSISSELNPIEYVCDAVAGPTADIDSLTHNIAILRATFQEHPLSMDSIIGNITHLFMRCIAALRVNQSKSE